MKKIKSNNKGFSLIELIIVIAIMAVLVAIIAPNLTKYLGTSKKNTDKKNADEVASTLKTCLTEYDTTHGSQITDNLTWDGSTCGASDVDFKKIVDAAIDPKKPQSKETGAWGTASVSPDGNDGYTITVTIGNASSK